MIATVRPFRSEINRLNGEHSVENDQYADFLTLLDAWEEQQGSPANKGTRQQLAKLAATAEEWAGDRGAGITPIVQAIRGSSTTDGDALMWAAKNAITDSFPPPRMPIDDEVDRWVHDADIASSGTNPPAEGDD